MVKLAMWRAYKDWEAYIDWEITPIKSSRDGASRGSPEPSNEASVSRPITSQDNAPLASEANTSSHGTNGKNGKRLKASNTVQTGGAKVVKGPLKFQDIPNLYEIFRRIELSTIAAYRPWCRNINQSVEEMFKLKGKLTLAPYDGSGPFANHDGHLFMAPDLRAYKLNRSEESASYFQVKCSRLSGSSCARYGQMFGKVTELTICYDSNLVDRLEPLLNNFLTTQLTKFSFVMARTDDRSIPLKVLTEVYRLLNQLVTPQRMPKLRELHLWITGRTSNFMQLAENPRVGFDLNLGPIMAQLTSMTLNCYCSNRVAILRQSNAPNLTQLTINSRCVLLNGVSHFTDSLIDGYIHQSLRDNVTQLRVTQVRPETIINLLDLFPNVTSLHISRDHKDTPYPIYQKTLEALVKYDRITELRLDGYELDRWVQTSVPSVKKLILCNKSNLNPAGRPNQVQFRFVIHGFARLLNRQFPNMEQLTIFCAEAHRLWYAENQLRMYYKWIRPLKKITLDLSAPEFQFVEEIWPQFYYRGGN